MLVTPRRNVSDMENVSDFTWRYALLELVHQVHGSHVLHAPQGQRPKTQKTLGEKEQDFLEALSVSP